MAALILYSTVDCVTLCAYTVSQKKQDTKLLAITLSDIPPRFKHVVIPPCEIWMQKNGIILKYVLQLMMNYKVA